MKYCDGRPSENVDPAVLAAAARFIQARFGSEVQHRRSARDPGHLRGTRARQQFSSVAFMLALARAAAGADRVGVAVTECDLFIPMLTFVFGQAQLRGRVALSSVARLRQEFYGVAPDPISLEPAGKRVGHELGHCSA